MFLGMFIFVLPWFIIAAVVAALIGAVGEDNFYLFGLRDEEIVKLRRTNSYHPHDIYEQSEYIKRIMNPLNSNMFCEKDYVLLFKMIFEELLARDYFMVLTRLTIWLRIFSTIG